MHRKPHQSFYSGFDCATEWGAREQRCLETLWISESGVEEVGNSGEGGRNAQRGREKDAEISCPFCGLTADDSAREPGNNHVRVRIDSVYLEGVEACPLHAGACGPHREWACQPKALPLACCSEWPVGRRSPQRAELARRLPITDLGLKWAAMRGALEFAGLLQRCAPGPWPASYVTTGVYHTFEFMVRALGGSLISSFLVQPRPGSIPGCLS